MLENRDRDNRDKAALTQQMEQIRQATGRRKYQLIINAENSMELVQRMPPQELFLLIKELGVTDCSDLVGMATPQQVNLFFDMDCWTADEMDADSALQWLQLLLLQDEEQFLRIIEGLDFEMLVLAVKKQLRIISGLESLRDDEDLMAQRKRFDQVYECEYRNDDAAKAMSLMQDILFRERQEFFLRLMEAVRHEMELSLQEEAFKFRSGRLADLGFVDSVEARSLYTYVAPDHFDPELYHKDSGAFTPAIETRALFAPAFMPVLTSADDLLGELLSGNVRDELWYELSYLLNRALSARRVDYGEPRAVAQVLEDVYHTLNVALGQLAGNDLNRAEYLFNNVYLLALFQLGFSITVGLRQRADRIAASTIGPYLDGSDAAVVAALRQDVPQFFSGLSDVTRADNRPFRNIGEVRRVERELECIEQLQLLFSPDGLLPLPAPEQLDLSGCYPQNSAEVTLSELFMTAVANQLLNGRFVIEPLPLAHLPRLRTLAAADAKQFAALRHQVQEQVATCVSGCAAFVDFCFDIWQQEFIALDDDELLPEYVGGLIMRLK